MHMLMIARSQNLVGIETFAYAVGQKVCTGLPGRVAALVQEQVGQYRQCNTDPVGLSCRSLKKKEE
jgi:hypothetical protein